MTNHKPIVAIIADLCVIRRSVKGRTISGAYQKAALAVIAGYEGRPISFRSIAARIGASRDCAEDAMRVLRESGMVRAHHGKREAGVYTIDWDLVQSMATDEPAYRLPGGRVHSNTNAAVAARARRRAKQIAENSKRELGVCV